MPGTANSGGRNRKSRAEHALTGTGRKDRGTHTTETTPVDLPDPPKGRPPIPPGLIGPALAEWERMVARLEAAQTLSIVDDAALYQYCCLFAETEAIGVALRTTVALVEALQGSITKWTKVVDRLDDYAKQAAEINAQIVEAIGQIVQLKKLEAKYVTQLRQGHMALRQFLVEFGMTPAARRRVSPSADGEQPSTNPLDRFIKTRVQ